MPGPSKQKKPARPPQHQERQPGLETAMTPSPRYEPRYPGSGRLDGKAALITGGDSGIGRACAVLFAREGADVAIAYLNEDDDAKETKRLVEREGRQAILLRGDVASAAFCADAVAETVKAFGRLDILINNAAEQHAADFSEISESQLRRTFETNVYGYFNMSQAALPHLPRGGAIVNTTSVTAFRGSKRLVDYSATRGAVLALTRSLSQHCLKLGVRVNAVAPGPVWTPLIPASFDAEKVKTFGSDSPMGRAGEPNEIAPCHLFLACADSSYMTGQTLHPNGGEIVGA
jgi:NAD(P)-dependent dehydrogenase (short-subunit alcohol dehydrogenase family)